MKNTVALCLLLACGLAGAASSQAAFDMFLVFSNAAGASAPAVRGESQDSTYGPMGAIEISEFSFGVSNSVTFGSATGGGGAGKAGFVQFQLKKGVDSASPSLFAAIGPGAHYDTVALYLRKSGQPGAAGGQDAYLIYTFKTVFITSIDWSGSAGDDVPSETISLAFGAMQISYRKTDPKGGLGPPSTQAWSVILNAPKL